MTDRALHRSSSPFVTSAAGPRLPARLRRRRVLVVPPAPETFRAAP